MWKLKTGDISGSPTIYNGRLYFSSFDLYFRCATKSGEVLWKYRLKEPTAHVKGPLVTGDKIFFGSWDGQIHCIDTNGKDVWKFEAGDIIFGRVAELNGIVYCGCANGNVYALDANTGKLLWKNSPGGPMTTGCAVNKQVAVIGSLDCNLYAFEPTTGQLLWKHQSDHKFPCKVEMQTRHILKRDVDTGELKMVKESNVYSSLQKKAGLESGSYNARVSYMGDMDLGYHNSTTGERLNLRKKYGGI